MCCIVKNGNPQAAVFRVLRPDGAVHLVTGLFHHRKADAAALSGRCPGGVAPVEYVKQPGQLLRLHACAVVGKGDGRHIAGLLRRDAEAALLTGFSDQSHFTNYFKRFIGLAPGVYREMFEAHTENGGTYGSAK